MPTIKGIPGPYRFFFDSFDCNEPPHVHVERDRSTCKFLLQPVLLAGSYGFSPRELNRIRAAILEHLEKVSEAWHGHCD